MENITALESVGLILKANMKYQNGEIDGVKIVSLKRIPDVRGAIMHGVRADSALSPLGEVYFKKLYPGIINGWHIHERMMLNYICIEGMMRLVLCDMREKSSTKGNMQEIFFGGDNYALVHIPPGIANAGESLVSPYSIFCNVASEPHNPNIKFKRIDPMSGEIPYDWNKKNF